MCGLFNGIGFTDFLIIRSHLLFLMTDDYETGMDVLLHKAGERFFLKAVQIPVPKMMRDAPCTPS